MMNQKPTDELDKILENTKPNKMGRFLSENKSNYAISDRPFYYYFKDVLYEKHIKLKDVYSFAGVSDSQGQKIISQERHTPNRYLIIRLCIAGHFSLLETNRALKLYGMSELYAKIPKDACIISALNQHIYDLAQIDDMLEENGLTKLSTEIT